MYSQNIEVVYIQENKGEMSQEMKTSGFISDQDWSCITKYQRRLFKLIISNDKGIYYKDSSFFVSNDCEYSKVRLNSSYDSIYIDLRTNKLLIKNRGTRTNSYHREDLHGQFEIRQYLKEDTIIAGYKCNIVDVKQKSNSNSMRIYYSEQLPISVGPSHFSGMPGLILGVVSNQQAIMAIKVKNHANVRIINFPVINSND